MSYASWFYAHGAKHATLMQALKAQGMDDASIMTYFRFENLAKTQTDFCPLFATQEPCHTMPKLNCFLCACPHFRFDDAGCGTHDGAVIYSYCAIDAKEGKLARFGDALHQDCSECTLPHKEAVVRKELKMSWFETMGECDLATKKGEA